MLQVGKAAYREVRYRRVVPHIMHSNLTITNPNPNSNLNPTCNALLTYMQHCYRPFCGGAIPDPI